MISCCSSLVYKFGNICRIGTLKQNDHAVSENIE